MTCVLFDARKNSRRRYPVFYLIVICHPRRYLYGSYDPAAGTGVIVYEDFTETGYRVDDPVLMLIGKERVEAVVQVRAGF